MTPSTLTTKRLSTRALSLCLSILLPAQGLHSCGHVPVRGGSSFSRLAGSKTELDFERANDSGTSVREGGGWSRSKEAEAASDYAATLADHMLPIASARSWKIEVIVEPDDGDYELSLQPDSSSGTGAAGAGGAGGAPKKPSTPIGLEGPELTDRKGDPNGDPALKVPYSPRFPLNPSRLKKGSEVLSDIAKRIAEKEAALAQRQKKFEDQSAAALQKGTGAGGLRGASGAARDRHSAAAKGIGDAIDSLRSQAGGNGSGSAGNGAGSSGGGTGGSNGTGGNTGGQGNVFGGLPGDGLPGGLAERLNEKSNAAAKAGASGANPFSPEFARHAQGAYQRAAGKGRSGDLPGAEGEERDGDLLGRLADTKPDLLPPLPEGPLPRDGKGGRATNTPAQTRGEALRTGLALFDVADTLDGAGLGPIADKARAGARTLFEVSLGMARMSGIFDVPLSVMELAGVTPTLDGNGNVALREASMLEMAFAMAALGAAGAAFAAGGWTAVVGVGVVGGLSKAAGKGLGKRIAQTEAETLAKNAAKNAPKVVEGLDGEGLKNLEKLLSDQGRKPERIKSVIDSFEPGSIERRIAPPNADTEVYRWHDGGKNAPQKGSYVSPDRIPDPVEARKILAIENKWNDMTTLERFRIPPGKEFYSGKVAPQGDLPGGGTQFFLPDYGESLELLP